MKSCGVSIVAGIAFASAFGTVAAAQPYSDAPKSRTSPSAPASPLTFDIAAYQRSSADFPGPPTSNITLRLAATLTQSLPRDWLVSASVSTQYGTDNLTQQEILAPAASTSLALMTKRDYLRDGGFAQSVELHTPNLCAAWLYTCRAIMFYDRNYIRYNRDYGGTLRSGSIGSVGIGMRMQVRRNMNLQLDAGRVTRNSQMPDDARARVSLRLGYNF